MTKPKVPGRSTDLEERLSDERMRCREGKRGQADYWSDRSTGGMVATAHYLATRAGAEMLITGGNAFDAAVAAGLALGVCEPAGSGIGGMAIALAYDAARNRIFVVEGACRAPQDATPEVVARSPSRYRGYEAVAVPTHLAVLSHLLARYGTLRTGAVLAPALRVAEEGFRVSSVQHDNTERYRDVLGQQNAGHLFLDESGQSLSVGTTVRQPALAATLRRLATAGFEDFYHGEIARAIVADVRANGGFVNERDLASSRLCREGPALSLPFGADMIHTVGPPGGGVALLEMLNILSEMGTSLDLTMPEGAVLAAAIIRQARRDRRAFGLKTDACGVGEAAELLTKDYAIGIGERIRSELMDVPGAVATQPQTSDARVGAGETSHISVMDAAGNAVALTQSIERSFGSAVATPSLGFLYNGYMRAFKLHTPAHPHFLRPGAPARSNAAPTIGLRSERPWVALGSTGSERMASGIFQVLIRLARNQGPFEAVHAPRLHCTPDSQVLIEAERFSSETLSALSYHGFSVNPVGPYSFAMGGVQLVLKQGEVFHGVGEPRRDGAAAGPN